MRWFESRARLAAVLALLLSMGLVAQTLGQVGTAPPVATSPPVGPVVAPRTPLSNGDPPPTVEAPVPPPSQKLPIRRMG